MTRETAAQRKKREAQEQAAREAKEEKEYPQRMMIALERATLNFNFELTVVQQQFQLVHRDTSVSFIIEPTWNREVWELYALEDELEKLDRARVEQERKEQAITMALNKLTKEEKELLNLI